ncbi:hypothetical protein M011DRAFT_467232 [Sporormia fimetaria CBS 119925]|uniref:Uncharacterized protein n=1 Tax=Sporormia fimetaria CBS 119925 TaxID=1340428 RepID=A0A6A6VC39_9PLEO|nr:hypothetical protein M011DRAFT_467232 [Sporormia fimetaria CBS 119925]
MTLPMRSYDDLARAEKSSGPRSRVGSTPNLLLGVPSSSPAYALTYQSPPASGRNSRPNLLETGSNQSSELEAFPSLMTSDPGLVFAPNQPSALQHPRPLRTASLLRDSEPMSSAPSLGMRNSSVPDIRLDTGFTVGSGTLSGSSVLRRGHASHNILHAALSTPSPFDLGRRFSSDEESEQEGLLLHIQRDPQGQSAETKRSARPETTKPTVTENLTPANPPPDRSEKNALNEADNPAQATQLTKCAIHGEDCDGVTVTQVHLTEQQRRSGGFAAEYPMIERNGRVMIDWEQILFVEVEEKKRRENLA